MTDRATARESRVFQLGPQTPQGLPQLLTMHDAREFSMLPMLPKLLMHIAAALVLPIICALHAQLYAFMRSGVQLTFERQLIWAVVHA